MSVEARKNNHTDEGPSNPRKRRDEAEEDTYDKTIEDSFPASDPPSSIPNPEDEDEDAA